MKNTNANKPAVVIGSEVCYRTKAGSYNRATVKDIVDSEYGKMAVLTYTDKEGNTVEFQKLLKSVWVYTGKKNKTSAETAEVEAEAEAPAAAPKAPRPEVAVGALVCYRTKAGKYSTATVKDIVDSEYGKMAVLTYQDREGNAVEFQKLLKSVFVYTGKKQAAGEPVAEAEVPAEEPVAEAPAAKTNGRKGRKSKKAAAAEAANA